MRLNPIVIPIVLACSALAHAQSLAEPAELTSLRESFFKARISALAPIERKYLDALSLMKDRLTKAGNLEHAIAVDAEIKSLLEQQATTAKAPEPSLPVAENGVALKKVAVQGFKSLAIVTRPMLFADAVVFLESQKLRLAPISSYKQILELDKEIAKQGLKERCPINIQLDSGFIKAQGTKVELPAASKALEAFTGKFFQGLEGTSDFYVIDAQHNVSGFRRGNPLEKYSIWFVTPEKQ